MSSEQTALLRSFTRWLPFCVLVAMALSFEPIRSGFALASQSCEFFPSWERVQGAIFNLRHLISYGVLFLVAAATFPRNRVVNVAVLVFLLSVLLEVEQSFFITGHCRLADLIPNAIGIGIAAFVFLVARRVMREKSGA